ncbi:F-box protein [Melia azedarach]|uniref:F-box protein n=1 Tax=Melia azedarach TaxID=155640 RepID=A0ACC1XRL9_MELAZ|nr:F-box protein [Melia azedarach]
MPGMILGPFDGIFCLFESYSFITLWNLATREYRVLPKCRATLRQNTIVNSSNVGFGLDPISNDFKLVLILTLFDKKRSVLCDFSHVVVYNLSTNSWRNLEGFDMNYDFLLETFDSTYLNGVCYWLTKQDFQFKVILSFDMSNEVFQEIQHPSSIPESADRTLGLHIDYLAVLVLDENYFEIWIMKEKRWTKHLSVGPFIEVEKPLAFWKKGSFLVESSTGDLLLYDPITREMRNLGLQNCWFAVLYKENLLTIKGG